MSVSTEEIEKLVSELPDEELKKFRAWYQMFDSERWDRQIEKDIKKGALEGLAQKALADHKAGKSKKL